LALLLLSSIALLQPQKIIGSVMPIFTYMGASALRQDDNYTFHVIQKTIESVLPPVISSSSTAEGKTIREIVQVFVDALPYVPQHRRVLLFAIVLKTISLKYLHPVILLLFSRHVRTPSQDTERDIGISDFTQSLISQFSVPAVLSSFAKIADSLVASFVPSHKPAKENNIDLYFESK
jgi:U3 small nucleolar RNA-associated protein 10